MSMEEFRSRYGDKAKKPRRDLEHDAQCILFNWANLKALQSPELRLLFAIPNGGHRHDGTARKLKAEGVKSGVPDVFLPVSRGGYHGLWIEMKIGKNKPTANQVDWMDSLEDQGYKCVVCYGSDEATNAIEEYLAY